MSEEDFKKYEPSYRQYYGSNYNKALRNLKKNKKTDGTAISPTKPERPFG